MSGNSASALAIGHDQKNEGLQALMEMSYLCVFPMAAKAAILLQVPEILAAASGPLSAKQIADKIGGNATSEAKLDRLLQALATHGLFSIHQAPPPSLKTYSLNAMSRLLVKDENGSSLASMFLLNTDPSHALPLQYLHEAILDDAAVPFEKAYGQPLFKFVAQSPQMGEAFYTAMSNLSTIVTRSILQSYDGFKDVKVLVDVGGGPGLNSSLIKAAHPHISVINFDMPFVVAKASPLPGVEHRGGNMLESVPSGGDAILLKTVLHNWDDGSCGRVLKNCYSALPKSGKLIIIEALLPEQVDSSCASRLVASFDLAMMSVFRGGKERSSKQFEGLVHSAGFNNFKVVLFGDMLSVMEAFKSEDA